MTLTDELLNDLTENDIMLYTTNPADEPHIVVGEDRFITVPDELKRIAVQHDHDIETVTFDCPRYWDGIDMSTMYIYINYMRSDGGVGMYLAKDVTVDSNDKNIMHFDWTISENVSMSKGALSFLVCIKKTDSEGNLSNHWNSELNKEMYVSEGLECEDSILNQYPDIVTDLLTRMNELELGYANLNANVEAYNDNVNGYDGRLTKVELSVNTLSETVKNIESNGTGGGSVICDTALSTSSTNPVQNKVVTAAINDIETTIGDIQTALVSINTSLEATLGV